MEENTIIEKLMQFGLTRQEANIYITLSVNGDLNGYEVSKITGISRSNAYSGLAGLVEKGAAFVIDGAVTKYTAVLPEEFCKNKIRSLEENYDFLVNNMPSEKKNSEGYITIEGEKHISDKMKHMLLQTKKRMYLSMPCNVLMEIRKEIKMLLEQQIKVVVITEKDPEIYGVILYLSDREENQIHMIADSQNALTGEYGKSSNNTCLYSEQKNFVKVFKDALRNEIKLIEITRGDIKK